MGVLSDTIRLGLKQSSLEGTVYPNVSKNHKIKLIFTINIYRKQQQINSASLSTGEDRDLNGSLC